MINARSIFWLQKTARKTEKANLKRGMNVGLHHLRGMGPFGSKSGILPPFFLQVIEIALYLKFLNKNH